MPPVPPQTKKIIKTFAWASFLNDLGADMIHPIWPLFVTQVLGANMAVLGLIDGLGDAIVSISQAVAGYFSDRLKKRKIFIWVGYLFGALSRLGYALTKTWPLLIPFKILDRAGKIRNAPRDAIIADVSHHENRGRHFGIVRMMDNLGAMFGIVIAILFVESLGYRNLFLLAAIPSLIGVLLILFSIREKKENGIRLYKGITLKDLSPDLRRFLFLSALFSLGAFSYSFLLIYAQEFGFQVVFIPVLYLIFTTLAFLSSLPFGKLSDRIGRKSVLIFSYLLWGLVCLGLSITQNQVAIVFAFILYGLHKGAIEPVQRSFVAELAIPEYRASTLGGFQMVIGLMALPASLIAGFLWDRIGKTAPFYFALGLTALATFLLLFVKEKNGNVSKSSQSYFSPPGSPDPV